MMSASSGSGGAGRNSSMGGFSPPGGESNMSEDTIKQAMASAGVGPSAGAGNFGSGGNQSGSGLSSNGGHSGSAGSASGSGNAANNSSNNNSQMQKPPVEPREVDTLGVEVKRGVGDIWTEVKQFFSINTWLGIDPNTMDPEEEAKAKQFHSRYQQLDQEQQAVARKMYQEKMQKKKMQEEEDRRKKQRAARKKSQSVVMPSSSKKGGGKQRAMKKLQQDRTTLSTTQGE